MIEIGNGITIGGQIIIGDLPVFVDFLVSETDQFFVTEISDNNFIDEQGPPYNV